MAKPIFVGDIGTRFQLTVMDTGAVVDISSASELTILFRRPDGSRLTKTGILRTDGTDGVMYYDSVSGDVSVAGQWDWQGRVILSSGGPFYTESKQFRVNTPI